MDSPTWFHGTGSSRKPGLLDPFTHSWSGPGVGVNLRGITVACAGSMAVRGTGGPHQSSDPMCASQRSGNLTGFNKPKCRLLFLFHYFFLVLLTFPESFILFTCTCWCRITQPLQKIVNYFVYVMQRLTHNAYPFLLTLYHKNEIKIWTLVIWIWIEYIITILPKLLRGIVKELIYPTLVYFMTNMQVTDRT